MNLLNRQIIRMRYHVEMLNSEIKYKPNIISIDDIRKIVEEYFRMDDHEMDLRSRKRKIKIPRQIAHYWCAKNKAELKWSLADIGKNIGNVYHATVLNSRNQIQNAIDTRDTFNSRLIKDHIEIIKYRIDAFYRTKEQKKALGTREKSLRESAGPYSKNELLSLASMAQQKECTYKSASIVRRTFETERNHGRFNGGSYCSHQSGRSIRHAEWEIRRAIRRRKFTNIM